MSRRNLDWQSAEAFAEFERLRGKPSEASLRSRLSGPVISVLVPVYNPPPGVLERCIESVRAQIYPNWELVLVDDASTSATVKEMLAWYSLADDRISVHVRGENGGIARATQDALDRATASFVALLDNDDELAPDALAEVAEVLRRHPAVDWIYSDFVHIDRNGQLANPLFKPDWSPERLMSQMYVCHLQVFRKSLVVKVGGFRPGFDGSQDYDLALRLMEKTDRIAHIPRPLYRWRVIPGSTTENYHAKPYANESALRALRAALVRRGIATATDGGDGRNGCSVAVRNGAMPGSFTIDYPLRERPLVSLLVPFRDKVDVTRRCVESVLGMTDYDNYEIVLIDNQSREVETLEWLSSVGRVHGPRVRVLSYERAFNHSAINNYAARHAKGDVLVLLNNDVEVLSPDWLDRMLPHALNPEVGCVGARLLYPTGQVQHAGVILGIGGVAGHALKYFDRRAPGYYSWPHLTLNVSAVTGACLMIRKSVYTAAGGLDETNLPTSFNDVDFCLRVRRLNLRNVYVGQVELIHYESLSRGADEKNHEPAVHYMLRTWGSALTSDPYYSPNLTLKHEDFRFWAD